MELNETYSNVVVAVVIAAAAAALVYQQHLINKLDDPRKASESFCRMIVIECGRLLSRQANIRRDTYPKSGTRLSTVN